MAAQDEPKNREQTSEDEKRRARRARLDQGAGGNCCDGFHGTKRIFPFLPKRIHNPIVQADSTAENRRAAAIIDLPREQILGIRFLNMPAKDAVDAGMNGGLVVAPSGTCFDRFIHDADYRRAILAADIVLPDSGLMVLLWRTMRGGAIRRVSGLAYLKSLFARAELNGPGIVFWILPNESARLKLLDWGRTTGRVISPNECYVAPIYQSQVHDEALLALCGRQDPAHIIIGLGAGAQEKLGLFLRENLPRRPAIHCIGGALGFITGDQIAIPDWADRFYLGWLMRLCSQPRVFIPRLWRARLLPRLICQYGERLPPLSKR